MKTKSNTIENFANYQDVKTKTVNWCTKMKDSGLLTPEQYDNCISTFTDVKTGVLPKNFKIPSTGIPHTYSLYNTRSKKLTPNLSDSNTNTIMIVTNTGLYMACNANNDIYYITDINDSNVMQKELYFTLIPQNIDVYSILSPYGKYLLANTNWGADFSGTSIGPMASWNLAKINTKITFESIQYRGFFLSFTDKDRPLEIIAGKNDSIQWVMIPKTETNINDKYGEYTGFEYIVTKDNILTAMQNSSVDIIALNNIKTALNKLQETIRTNYTLIEKYMKDTLDYQVKVYNLSLQNYQTSIKSISLSSTISRSSRESLFNSIPPPSGLNIAPNDVNIILYNIANTKNMYLRYIDNEISIINQKLEDINTQNSKTDYNKFINDIKNEIANVKKRIKTNNLIMGRQQDNYDTLNNDVSYISQQKNKFKKLDNTLKLNLNIVNGYQTQSKYLLNIYPAIIIILLILLIYLSYITFIKFKANIYDKY